MYIKMHDCYENIDFGIMFGLLASHIMLIDWQLALAQFYKCFVS